MSALSKAQGKTITVEDLFNVALSKIIRINNKQIKELWSQLIKDVDDKKGQNDVFVRSHGRNGIGNADLLRVLEAVFGRKFTIDKTNNAKPKKIIEECCGKDYQDYQISHLFEERTCNPLLFGAPWMICYVPKIIDPFTGHESKGFPKLTQSFISWAFQMNQNYIEKYNSLIIKYWGLLKTHLDNNSYDSRRRNAMIRALAPLILSYEQLPKAKRNKAYLNLFNDKEPQEWHEFIKMNQFKEKTN